MAHLAVDLLIMAKYRGPALCHLASRIAIVVIKKGRETYQISSFSTFGEKKIVFMILKLFVYF